MPVEYLTVEQIIELHDRAIREFGGLPGLRSRELLESAVFAPRHSAFGDDAYPTVPDKAAAYAVSLSENHPFLNGNKRTAAAAMLVLLDVNHNRHAEPFIWTATAASILKKVRHCKEVLETAHLV